MNQLYAEAGVKRKENAKSMALRALMITGAVIGVILMLVGGFVGIAGIVMIVAVVFLFPRLNVEYEYVFVDGQIDFDRIAGKARRKTLFRIDMDQVEIIAPESSHALDAYSHIQCEKKDFSSGDRNAKPYIIICSKDSKKYRIAFEPNEKMLTMIKQKSPRKLSQY